MADAETLRNAYFTGILLFFHLVNQQYEIDFIANNGTEKYYIQSAFALDTEEKRQQELNSLLKISDSFRKIVIVGTDIAEYTDDNGIRYMGLFQFLLT